MHRFVTRSDRSLPVRAVLALLGASMLAGCIGGPPACEAGPAEIELTLTADTLTPSDPSVCRGSDVTLTITPRSTACSTSTDTTPRCPRRRSSQGEVIELAFTAERSGQFPIELHTDENTQGVDVGLFTVNEP